ncbi:hypothetical protein QBC34DRAFT_54180 [Podospora aff. communis PSN243]|uniref:Pyridoxamine 5'-phosphate oxidase Alr4036 family FMN-binding domain-containing protein n=1 Tax=Podospora aff. communis PSN243 TaxID=3040156 RepID=A0AAV9GUC8_9PEZI|nr:hypothetical protein QBC34DRAFT_54180 [Podospora aff. communis PSN243]
MYQFPPVGQYYRLRAQAEETRQPQVVSPPPTEQHLQPAAQPTANHRLPAVDQRQTTDLPSTAHHPFPLLAILASKLSHTHTLLSGPEALLLHGCPFPLPADNPLTLSCSSSDLPIVRSWSAAAGWDVHRPKQHGNGEHDEIVVSASELGEEGSRWSWVVRLEGVEEQVWDRMEAGREMRYGLAVLGLEDLLGQFGRRWEISEGEEDGTRVVWILARLAERGRVVDVEVGDGWWERFVWRYPVSRRLLETCGLGV